MREPLPIVRFIKVVSVIVIDVPIVSKFKIILFESPRSKFLPYIEVNVTSTALDTCMRLDAFPIYPSLLNFKVVNVTELISVTLM